MEKNMKINMKKKTIFNDQYIGQKLFLSINIPYCTVFQKLNTKGNNNKQFKVVTTKATKISSLIIFHTSVFYKILTRIQKPTVSIWQI